jgi:hypothetical protein
MAFPRSSALALAITAIALAFRPAAGATGDALCDAALSTVDTCVVTGTFAVPDGTTLAFTAPAVELRGALALAFSGTCSNDQAGPCAADADCAAPARCRRSGAVEIDVARRLAIAAHAAISARGAVSSGDGTAYDAGTIVVHAGELDVAGTIDASAQGATGVPAGRGGTIELLVDGAATIEPTARVDASSPRGGCGGTIRMDCASGVTAAGTLDVEGATRGGTITLLAGGSVTASGTFAASNTDGDLATRAPCPDGSGGGRISLSGSTVLFTGSAKARGREAGGGLVTLAGARGVVVDSTVGTTPISVLGGDIDAFTTGGGVFLLASGGDVDVRRGAIEADGLDSGVGSDAGGFVIRADGALRCATADTPCASDGDCDGDACVEKGGSVTVAPAISAAGGAGAGSGCLACEIRGSGTVTVSGPVGVGGGKRRGVGGKVTIAAGRDLTLGPGAVTASAADGGDVIVSAGERAASMRDVGGVLSFVLGTQVWANAFLSGGFGGHVAMEGCAVDVGSGVAVHADGGPDGGSAGIDVVAHDRLEVGALATLSALPDGVLSLVYRADGAIAPDAVVLPPAEPVQDPTLAACPACGNESVEPPEECDGHGTCPAASDVCLPAGAAGACTCRDTCGTVAGVQPGEDCDGADLGGETCAALGYAGGALACTTDCRFDTSACVADVCGNGRTGAGEACDPGGIDGAPPDFAGATCVSVGRPAGGTLACTATCDALVVGPHCAGDVAIACTTAAACGDAGPCVGGCIECGNGLVDPGEACDEGAANGGGPSHCRPDCTLPRCGDETVDFPHCAADPDAACSAGCAPGTSCVAGEACDMGQALCLGGARAGEPCCAATDCPGGACEGDDCSRNRDDVPGCCPCDCGLPAPTCDGCDDGNPCTADRCGGAARCTHVAVADGTPCGTADACGGTPVCEAGACATPAAVRCDDADVCTRDACDPAAGCTHDRLGFRDAAESVAASLFVPACERGIPGAVVRRVRRGGTLVDAAAHAGKTRAARLVRRAERTLFAALAKARIGRSVRLSPSCRTALVALVSDAVARVGCLDGG